MRCKQHCTDLSSLVGVCATCLRERLCPLLAAQQQSQSQSQSQSQTLAEQNRNPVTKTVNSVNQRNSDRNRRFFTSPQVVPTTAAGYNPCRKKQNSFINFSLFSNLFRSKKRNSDPDPDPNYRGSRRGDETATSASSSSPFWFSNNGYRKKQPVSVSGAGVTRRRRYCPDRGVSPVRDSDCDGSSGYETCESRKQTPAHPVAVRRGAGGGGGMKNVSGMSFCLSPLVRVSPCRRGVAPVDGGGDIRGPAKGQLYNNGKGKGFCANRSRKIADFGRFVADR